MKIVINRCFGGFGLSESGMILYSELSGIKLNKVKDPTYPNSTFWQTEFGDNFFDFNIARDDPNLVRAVEQLGEDSFDSYAELEVMEIPDGINWEISSYDGYESIEECHRRW